MKNFRKKFLALTFVASVISNEALACACSGGIFGVGTSSLIPHQAGGLVFAEYDYINQSQNWKQNKKSDGANNEDKSIKSQVVTAGMQYMFNRSWGAAVRVPYMSRSSKMVTQDGMMMDMNQDTKVRSIGDIKINGIYSGFSPDMSTGITFGLKLPTGQTNAKGFDSRNMQIGTGSTDSILGAYHVGKIANSTSLNWYVQGTWQHALVTRNGYRPGDEISGATGVTYSVGQIAAVKNVTPILQITGSRKASDSGWNSNKENSGYVHTYFAPALELSFGNFKTYADVEFPIYQHTKGNQLVANRIYKFILGYNF